MIKLLGLILLSSLALVFSCTISSECNLENPKCNAGVCGKCDTDEDCSLHSTLFSYCNSTRGYCYSIPPPYPAIWGNQVAVVIVLTILHIGFAVLLIVAWRFSKVSSFGSNSTAVSSGTSKTNEDTTND
jgi:hypothetical protein